MAQWSHWSWSSRTYFVNVRSAVWRYSSLPALFVESSARLFLLRNFPKWSCFQNVIVNMISDISALIQIYQQHIFVTIFLEFSLSRFGTCTCYNTFRRKCYQNVSFSVKKENLQFLDRYSVKVFTFHLDYMFPLAFHFSVPMKVSGQWSPHEHPLPGTSSNCHCFDLLSRLGNPAYSFSLSHRDVLLVTQHPIDGGGAPSLLSLFWSCSSR